MVKSGAPTIRCQKPKTGDTPAYRPFRNSNRARSAENKVDQGRIPIHGCALGTGRQAPPLSRIPHRRQLPRYLDLALGAIPDRTADRRPSPNKWPIALGRKSRVYFGGRTVVLPDRPRSGKLSTHFDCRSGWGGFAKPLRYDDQFLMGKCDVLANYILQEPFRRPVDRRGRQGSPISRHERVVGPRMYRSAKRFVLRSNSTNRLAGCVNIDYIDGCSHGNNGYVALNPMHTVGLNDALGIPLTRQAGSRYD